ncbi:hypothetical protein [Solirubrobacter soli]|uniref:hypothetical protein n=1 Tax=Solirubrobacter soli TaxID=363832 RepID=UPI0003F80250|nr:hypothetical protein [Solirubrobacter soli]
MIAKLAGFALVLAVVFGVAAVAGKAVGPDREGATTPKEPHGGMGDEHGAMADPVRGLAVAEDGMRLELAATSLPRGEAAALRFRIAGAKAGDFEVTHEKRMHLIVVRRDGRGFQHLHPVMEADGTWSAPITLADAGAYRVFADFQRGGTPHTLAADLTVDGDADYLPFPQPATVAETDGYTVTMTPHGGELGFAITRAGKPVETEPYLGAGGHLVALREGDLAFLHVHPTEGHGVEFETDLDKESRYHLYLQFKHDGRVHTAEFTR